MNRKTFGRVSVTGAVLLALFPSTAANAAPLKPVAPASGAASPLAGQRCTVEVLNVSGVVISDGSAVVSNVPANQGSVRMRQTCTDPLGVTTTGQSSLVAVVSGGAVNVNTIDFDTTAPIATKLQIAPLSLNLNGIGATQQLVVQSTFANQSTGIVTNASNGTTYRSSNLAVATVGPDGQVTAVGPGTAIISAINEGAMGLATVTVRSASLTSIVVTPAQVTLSINPAFSLAPAQLRVLGLLSDGEAIDLSSASSGTTYSSSAPGIAAVSPDGSVVGVANGSATITITDPQSGTTKQVPVTVSAFSPVPIGAYNTPGYAYNVDIDGSLIFVADGVAGLQIFNAASSTIIGKLAFIGKTAIDVKVRGGVAAVALGAGFALVDVSDASQPKLLHTNAGVGSTNDIWLSGNRLYVASSSGLFVYDISNPVAPTLVGSATGFYGTAVAADSTRGVAVVVTSLSQVKVIQTSGLWPQATLSLPCNPDDVTLFGTSAYVADTTCGVREVDITNPTSPAFKAISSMAVPPGNPNALGVAVRQTSQGLIVAAGDNIFQNAVPLFNAQLKNTFTINFTQPVAPSYVPVQWDADGTGIALGDGFGAVSVGSAGIQVFRTQQLTDNTGIPPTVSVTQPTGGSGVFSGQFAAIDATATDDVSVSFVEFLVGGAVVAVDATAPFSGDFVPGASCTTQVVHARATDTSGNVSDSLPVSVKVLCAENQPCSTGADCENNVCAGGTCQATCNLVYPSCKALQVACPTATSGTRTIDPDGAGPLVAFSTYCEMDLGNGGWTLVAKMSNQDTKNWVNAKTSWTGTNAYGNTADLTAGQDAKSVAWGTVPAAEFLLTDDTNNYIATTSNCIGNTTMSQFFTTALAGYPALFGPDPNNQYYYKDCTTFNTIDYVPAWTFEPNFLDQSATSPSNTLNQGYLTIAKTDDANTQAVISFYTHDTILIGPNYTPDVDESYEFEADVGLSASEFDGVAFGTSGEAQDIGGPSSCSLVDLVCKTQYPQTVYMFVR